MSQAYKLDEEPDPADYTNGRFYLLVTHWHAEQIAAGYVPDSVKAMARLLLDYENQDALRAARPVRTGKKRAPVAS